MWRPPLRWLILFAMLALAVAYLLQLLSLTASGNGSTNDASVSEVARQESRQLVNLPQWVLSQRDNPMIPLTDDQLRTLASLSNQERFLRLLQPILIPRVSGTPGNVKVQQHIISTMQSLGYTVELDSFDDSPPAPHSRRTFTNIIATLDPNAPRRLVLACHFDSKFDNRGEFIGATDSAVPCAMLMDLATVLRGHADSRTMKTDITLQLLFLDGEEAFGEWSRTDSLYGARHLANKLSQSRNQFAPQAQTLTQLNSMDVFVLLDLIGTTDTGFKNLFSDTATYYARMSVNEDRLSALGLVKQWGRQASHGDYFNKGTVQFGSFVDDDHRPFLEKGVRIVHLISLPFPSVWHKYSDNFSNVHYPTVNDINVILRAFVCEYLSCRF